MCHLLSKGGSVSQKQSTSCSLCCPTEPSGLFIQLLSCVLTPNKPEFERLVEAAISFLSGKLQSGPSDADRGFYTALLSELCLVEEDGPNSTNSSFYYGHRLKCRSGSDTSSRLGGAIRGAVDTGLGGSAGAEASEPSAVAVRRVSALSAALGGVTILRKVRC
jgi:hypothetical protein